MDVTQDLSDTENALRDFIINQLSSKLGKNWIEVCGVTEERLNIWRKRQETEQKRQPSGSVDIRLIYYSDFYDLKTILKKHWTHFSEALGEWKTMEVFLTELERLRDPDAHRRGLMPHQKHLLVGISGEIRNRLIRYRSKQETGEDYYPRIESASDNLGNFWSMSTTDSKYLFTRMYLRPGDILEFIVSARDPLGEPLEYCMVEDVGARSKWRNWQEQPEFRRVITKSDVQDNFVVGLVVRSHRPYHASLNYDDLVRFSYTVLPPKIVE